MRRTMAAAVAEPSPDPTRAGTAAPAFNRPTQIVLLLVFVLVVVFRLPGAWVHGRFQDEEATVFLAYAWHFPWMEALFRPFAGYWNLGANATTVAAVQLVRAGILPLERAPWFTMGIALAFQALPASLLLTGRAPWLTSRIALVAALLVLALMPATDEVFFNVLHIQFHLALCAALILALGVPERRPARALYAAILFLGPLCGPGAIVLLPLFALRAMEDRERRWQLLALAAGAAIQLALFYSASPLRGAAHRPGMIAAGMAIRLVVAPVSGVWLANLVTLQIMLSPWSRLIVWGLAGGAVLVLGSLAAVAVQRRDSAFWFTAAALLLAIATFGFGFASARTIDLVSVTAGERYNFLPGVLLAWALIVIATRGGRGRSICVAACAVILVNAAMVYPRPDPQFATGPAWPDEVRLWHADHRHPLAVWPGRWAADLSDTPRACTPPRAPFTQSTDPRYCESGWIAAFYRGAH